MAVRFSEDQVVKATGGRGIRSGAHVSFGAVSTDTRALTPGCLFVALVGERFDGHTFLAQAVQAGAAGAIVQKGRPRAETPEGFALFEVDDTLSALGGLARFHRGRFKIPVGAVTGSNGKTSTKEMIAAILATRGPALKTEGNLNNEIGVPLTLFQLSPQHVAAVIEMGMNHPGEIGRLTNIAQPDAGLITVVQPAHLEGLGSIEGVARAKGELFEHLGPAAIAVVNEDDAHVRAQKGRARGRILTFGSSAGVDVRLEGTVARGREGQSVTVHTDGKRFGFELAFVGEHNARNAAGAFALGLALGYSAEECAKGLGQAKPWLGRLNVVDAPGGITVIDDSYNANPGSMDAALSTLGTLAQGRRAVAVLGDMLELGPEETSLHRALGVRAAQVARVVAFFGPRSASGHEAASALQNDRSHFTEIDSLVAWLREKVREGDVVLVKGSRGMRLERVVQALTGKVQGGAHGC